MLTLGSQSWPQLPSQLLTHVRLFASPWSVAHGLSSVYGILQARTLEWVAISSTGGYSWPESPVSPASQEESLPTEPLGKSDGYGVSHF